MQIKISVLKGKIVENREKIADVFTSTADGDYVFSLDRINPEVTTRDYQKLYFDRIDACSQHVGYTRYELHEMFKQHLKIETTKDLNVTQWKALIVSLRWWAYTSFDCMV